MPKGRYGHKVTKLLSIFDHDLQSKSVDDKQDYSRHADVFVTCKDVKFQKSYNFPGNTNFERPLLDLLKTKLNCSY